MNLLLIHIETRKDVVPVRNSISKMAMFWVLLNLFDTIFGFLIVNKLVLDKLEIFTQPSEYCIYNDHGTILRAGAI